jgi:hypothetical protein
VTCKRLWLWSLLFLFLACASERPPSQPVFAGTARTAPLHFRYELADGKGALTSEAMRGKPTVIAFLTTYDLASQAQARFLSGIFQRHTGINAAGIVLERAENRPLIVAFRDALRLAYPVAIGDAALISGEGPFGDVHSVPSTVVLDSENRLVWKHIGLAREEEIEDALRHM